VFKRLTWFVAGAVAGASGTVYARRKARSAAERYRPVAIARSAAGRVRVRAADMVDALRDGRLAMRTREAELLAELDDQAGSVPDRHELRVVRIDRHGQVVGETEVDVDLDRPEATEPERAPRGRPGPRRRARR
jgi:hypothetical protein